MKLTDLPANVSAPQPESPSGPTPNPDKNNLLFQCWALTSDKGKIRGRDGKTMPALFRTKAEAEVYARLTEKKAKQSKFMPYVCRFTLIPDMDTLKQIPLIKQQRFRIL
jgi:hypothetical protein